jgi:hypothetical protein
MGGIQMPGLLGKLMGQPQPQGQPGQAGGQPGLGGSNNNALLAQAMKMLQGPQMQPPQMMNLLSGPRG